MSDHQSQRDAFAAPRESSWARLVLWGLRRRISFANMDTTLELLRSIRLEMRPINAKNNIANVVHRFTAALDETTTEVSSWASFNAAVMALRNPSGWSGAKWMQERWASVWAGLAP